MKIHCNTIDRDVCEHSSLSSPWLFTTFARALLTVGVLLSRLSIFRRGFPLRLIRALSRPSSAPQKTTLDAVDPRVSHSPADSQADEDRATPEGGIDPSRF